MEISVFGEIIRSIRSLNLLEASGLVFGLLCVLFLIKEKVWTWPLGIIYVLISFVIFFEAKLYADLILHVFFLFMNIYGWYYWVYGRVDMEKEVPVTTTVLPTLLMILGISVVGIFISGQLLTTFTDADLAYWDSTTSVLSVSAMWLSARKKIENWWIWLFVDILATGIYAYKGLYFYSTLYFIYIFLAIAGYRSWEKSLNTVNR